MQPFQRNGAFATGATKQDSMYNFETVNSLKVKNCLTFIRVLSNFSTQKRKTLGIGLKKL